MTDLKKPTPFPIAAADRCVLCGLCLPHCPTYRLAQDENESPRGRISLLRAVHTHALTLDARIAGHLSHCTDCRACERVCPSGVSYGQLIGSGRELCGAQTKPKAMVRALLWLVTNRPAMKLASVILPILQQAGVIRVTGWMFRHSPLVAGLALASRTSARRQQTHSSYDQPHSRKVVLFHGCLTSLLDTDTYNSAQAVLRHFGVEVVVPANQTCCGGLHREAGEPAEAEKLRTVNRQALAVEGAEAIVTLASGCGARLAQDLGLPNLPVMDIHAYLARLPLPETAELLPLSQRVAVQDPCSLRNTLRSEQGVYALLRRIPDLTVEPLEENQFCCGGAGLYMLREPAWAEKLRAPKLDALQQCLPDVVVSANLGCALHLAAGLRSRNLTIPVMHPLVLFIRQLRTRPKLR